MPMPKTIKQALREATQELLTVAELPNLDAQILLSFVTGKDKEFLYSHPENNITADQERKFNELIARRSTGEPIAYLIQTKEFYDLEFFVDNRVLIPRPDTELLIDEVKNIYQKNNIIADVGTGSGAIAVTLSKILHAKVLATDISEEALEVAKKNAEFHQVQIDFFQGNLIEPIKNHQVDILVANLPYGDEKVWSQRNNKKTIGLKFEPAIALYAENSGLDLFDKLFRQISELGKPPKHTLIEIDSIQERPVVNIIKNYLTPELIETKKDLSGLKRVLIIKLKN